MFGLQFLEVIRLESHAFNHDDVLSRDMYLLQVGYFLVEGYLIICLIILNCSNINFLFWQLCEGIDESAVGACAQLIFSPVDQSFADEAPLLPSGFRVIPLDLKAVE